MTIQAKTALLFTLVTATIIALLSMAIYFFVSQSVSNDFLKRLELRTIIAHRLRFERNQTSADVYNKLREQYLETLPHQKGYLLQVERGSGAIDGNKPKDLPARYYEQVVQGGGNTIYFHNGSLHYAGQLYQDKSGDFIFLTSAVNEYGRYLLNNLKTVLLFTFFASIVIVFTISIFFSRQTFQPVRAIIARVRDISAHNLHLRLETKVGKDEITELANTFNNMLDRLETAFETQNNFVSNASHELRTPLTAIAGEAEIALSRERSPEEYRQSLQIISSETEKLQQLTGSLLSLAQSGFDGKKQSWGDVRMDELLFSIKDSQDKIETGNPIELRIHSWPADMRLLTTAGNNQLLQLAVSNVIRNACKYSGDRPVLVELFCADDEIRIEVSDEGIGIPQKELPYIYDPFFRASNANAFDGYGVGLPLTRAIVRLHKGNIQVTSEEGKGTRVTLQFLPVTLTEKRAHT